MGVACSAAYVLVACEDTDTGPATSPDSGTETSSPIDAGGAVDANDAGNTGDAGGTVDAAAADAADAADAGPTLSTTIGPTGSIRIYMDAIFATFSEDDTIVRASDAPECVVHVRSISKPYSPAGTLTIGGPIVGSDGGTDQTILIEPDTVTPASLNQYVFFGPVFPPNEALLVQLEGAGTTVFPAMPVQSLNPPAFAPVVITKPVVPDAGAAIVVPSTAPFEIVWTVPAGATATKRVIFGFREISPATGGTKSASIFCSYPLTAGKGSIPPSVLADVKTRVGANASGRLHIYAGGYKEFVASGASYAIEVVREDSTSFSTAVAGEITGELL
jgi:hypothetical protein